MSFPLPFSISPEVIRYLVISGVASLIATVLTDLALTQTVDLTESTKEFVVRSVIFYILFLFLFLIIVPVIELVWESVV